VQEPHGLAFDLILDRALRCDHDARTSAKAAVVEERDAAVV